MGDALEVWQAQLLCQGVDARMAQQLVTAFIVGCFPRCFRSDDCVITGILELEEATEGVNILFWQGNASLWITRSISIRSVEMYVERI